MQPSLPRANTQNEDRFDTEAIPAGDLASLSFHDPLLQWNLQSAVGLEIVDKECVALINYQTMLNESTTHLS